MEIIDEDDEEETVLQSVDITREEVKRDEAQEEAKSAALKPDGNLLAMSQKKEPPRKSSAPAPIKPLGLPKGDPNLQRKMSNVDAMKAQLAARLTAMQGKTGGKSKKSIRASRADSSDDNASSSDSGSD